MKDLKAKLQKKGGFTLIEMLIVVAIIAILIAISIPLVNGALERSREATDAANERAFKAALTIEYLNTEATAVDVSALCAYDAVNGKVVALGAAPDVAYGQGTTALGVDKNDHTTSILYGNVLADGTAVMKWSTKAAAGNTALTVSGELTSTKVLGTADAAPANT